MLFKVFETQFLSFTGTTQDTLTMKTLFFFRIFWEVLRFPDFVLNIAKAMYFSPVSFLEKTECFG